MADCQCSKCSFHRGKDHETKLKAENNKSFTAHTASLLPSSNHVHNNHRQPNHVAPTPPSLLQRTLEDPPRDIHSYLLDSSLRHVNYNGYHDNLMGCGEIDDDDDVGNSLSDSDFDNEGDEGVDYDDRRGSCSPRRASQSSGISQTTVADLLIMLFPSSLKGPHSPKMHCASRSANLNFV